MPNHTHPAADPSQRGAGEQRHSPGEDPCQVVTPHRGDPEGEPLSAARRSNDPPPSPGPGAPGGQEEPPLRTASGHRTSRGEAEAFDAIVVGSGAAGGWVAKELCEQGLTVLMLEAGRSIDAEKDFPAEPKRGTWLLSRFNYALRGQHIQVRCANFTPFTSHFYVNDRLNPYSHPKDKPFLWFRGRQIGGRLHTWCRAALRMSDFELKPSAHGEEGPDWPLSYREIEPYYDKVERYLGLLGARAGVPNLPDGRYSDPMPLTGSERRFLERTADGRADVRVVPGRIIRHNPLRTPLPILAALRTGNLTIRPDAAVSHLLTDGATGKASGVAYVDCPTKKWREAKGRAVVLCASALESTRILLNSACPRHPGGVGNSSGLLGRFVSDHLMIGLKGRMPEGSWEPETFERQDLYDFGVPGLYIPRLPQRSGTGQDYRGGFGIQCGIGRGGPSWWMLAFGEMQPRFENGISIEPGRKDAWGIPTARIECAHSPQDEAKIAAMRDTMLDLVQQEGFKVVMPDQERSANALLFRALRRMIFMPSGAFRPGASIHEVGGARMGSGPEDSVVDPFNRCWDAPNVLVCDGACFVSSGFQNHTLTIMALAVRASDHLVESARKGDL